MKVGMRLAILLAIVGAMVVTVARAQSLPTPPVRCYKAEYDLNRDGKVNEYDMNRWKDLLFKSGEQCYNGASALACPAGMDVDGNGIVEFADLNIMLEFLRECYRPRPYVVPW